MFCPKCGAEYRPGFTRCFDCELDLVDEPPQRHKKREKQPREESSLRQPVALVDAVPVYRSGHPGRVALAQSILQSAGVPFVVLNEATQDFVGLGRFPAGFNIALGPIEILVSRPDAEDARLLLEDLEAGADT